MKKDIRLIRWRVLVYAVVAYLAVVGIWVPMKLQGLLAAWMDWFHILVLPAAGLAVWPALVFWWAHRQGRPPPAPEGE